MFDVSGAGARGHPSSTAETGGNGGNRDFSLRYLCSLLLSSREVALHEDTAAEARNRKNADRASTISKNTPVIRNSTHLPVLIQSPCTGWALRNLKLWFRKLRPGHGGPHAAPRGCIKEKTSARCSPGNVSCSSKSESPSRHPGRCSWCPGVAVAGIPRQSVTLTPAAGETIRLAVRRAAAGLQLTWNSRSGSRYRVQSTTNLKTWTDVQTVTATGSTTSWTNSSPTAPLLMYRVVME